jgi:anti-sigma factor (TIGR02949 family)
MTGSGFCERVAEALDIYLDRELPADEMNAIAKHLEQCPDCARELGERQAFRARLRAAARSTPVPADLVSGIDRRLNARARHGFLHPGMMALAAAAMLAVCIGAWRVEFNHPDQNAYLQQVSTGVARIMRVGLNDHVHCAVFRKYPAQPPSLEHMTQLLGRQYADLEPIFAAHIPPGVKVVLAHQCSFRGRRYVHLIARDGTRLISLVIARRQEGEAFENDLRAVAEEGGEAMYSAGAPQFSIAGFETPAHLVYLVSDLSQQQNLHVMEAMAVQLRDALSKAEQQSPA